MATGCMSCGHNVEDHLDHGCAHVMCGCRETRVAYVTAAGVHYGGSVYNGVDLFEPVSSGPIPNGPPVSFSNQPSQVMTIESLDRACQSIRETARYLQPISDQLPPIGPTMYKEYEARGWIRDGHYTREFFSEVCGE